MARSAEVNIGDNALAAQYNNLRKDAIAAAHLLAHEQATPDLTLKVESGVYYIGSTRVAFAGGNSPSFVAPTTNPRIDLLVIDSAGVLSIVQGTEAPSPSIPTYPQDKVTLCEVFNRVGETSIKDIDDTSNGYIQRDVRPFLGKSFDPASVDQDIIPATDDTHDLGSAAKQWAEVRTVKIFVDGAEMKGTLESFTAGENLTIGDPAGVASGNKVKKAFNYGAALGSETVFKATATTNVAAAQIADDKFVLAYWDGTNVRARVATVSGTTPSFGTEVTISGVASQPVIDVCKLDTDKFVVVYSQGNRTRLGRPCSVSGTTITLGTIKDFGDFPSADTSIIKCAQLDVDKFVVMAGALDTAVVIWANTVSALVITKGSDTALGMGAPPTDSKHNANASLAQVDTDKFVAAYRKVSDNDGYVKIGTVSGTIITLGGETSFNAADTSEIDAVCPTTTNLIVSYKDEGNSNQGTLVAATISGTTPTFGSEVVFETGITNFTSIAKVGSKTVVIAYQDAGDSNHGKVVSAKINGNTVSGVGTGLAITTFNAATTTYIAIADTNSTGSFIVGYRDEGNSNQGTAVVGEGDTVQNFTGIVQATVTSGNPVDVKLIGTDSNQSGLTTGQKYFAVDGALSTSNENGDDSKVGWAKTATSIVIT
ncbi:MAG: hypothetical protein KJI72_00260 [Patescibacteria group bacterium]|nr:hypothetical protein [Patescibacteria group bacterium]